MDKKEIDNLLEKNFPFYTGLSPELKKIFIHSLLHETDFSKFILSGSITGNELLQMKLAAVYTAISFSRVDVQMHNIFRNIEAVDILNSRLQEEYLSKFIIPIRCSSENFWHSAVYDMIYGFYYCYTLHKETLTHIAQRIGKAEILIIDRFDFQKKYREQFCIKPDDNTFVAMFASVGEQFFNHPSDLKKNDNEMFSAMVDLWNINPLEMNIPFKAKKEKQFNRNGKISFISGKLPPVYNFTIFSIFLSLFAFLYLADKTLITFSMLIILITIFTLVGFSFLPGFKKYNIPVFKIPFFLFSLFGVGMNLMWIFLAVNYISTNPKIIQTFIFPFEKEKVVYAKELKRKDKTIEYLINIKIKKGLKRRISFRTHPEKLPRYVEIKAHRGLLGFYVIKEKNIYTWN